MQDPSRRRKVLEKMENTLVVLLRNNSSSEKISQAVEKVREAKLSLFKGQKEIAQYKETENEKLSENIQQHLANIESEINFWRSLSQDEILKIYRNKDV